MSDDDTFAGLEALLTRRGAAGAISLGNGAFELIPADRCPCGAFSRSSKYHRADCRDWVDPVE